MYVVPPPQRSDPRSEGRSGDLRVYQTWKGSNVSVLFPLFLIFFLFYVINVSKFG